MYYNSFDICAAYYHFCNLEVTEYVKDKQAFIKRQRKALSQLRKLRYKPGPSDRNLATISENAKEIYMNLIRKYF